MELKGGQDEKYPLSKPKNIHLKYRSERCIMENVFIYQKISTGVMVRYICKV